MTANLQTVNAGEAAPIKNVAACLSLVRALQNRHPLQPNLGVFAGFSGYGKSVAALYAQNKTDAAYVEVSDTWTRKKLLSSILSELGQHRANGTLSDMEDEIIGILARDPKRPLLIDEADKLVDKNMIELVRMIAKKSNVPVLLIGEELFPKKLEHVDRFRDLVLVMGYAQPCDLDDTRTLAKAFYPSIHIADELLDLARSKGEGRVRRIGNTLHSIAGFAMLRGMSDINLNQYEGLFSEGKLPSRREAA
ncbi:hypothetical protein J2W92_002297 [Rhizobium leguminosarum]